MAALRDFAVEVVVFFFAVFVDFEDDFVDDLEDFEDFDVDFFDVFDFVAGSVGSVGFASSVDFAASAFALSPDFVPSVGSPAGDSAGIGSFGSARATPAEQAKAIASPSRRVTPKV